MLVKLKLLGLWILFIIMFIVIDIVGLIVLYFPWSNIELSLKTLTNVFESLFIITSFIYLFILFFIINWEIKNKNLSLLILFSLILTIFGPISMKFIDGEIIRRAIVILNIGIELIYIYSKRKNKVVGILQYILIILNIFSLYIFTPNNIFWFYVKEIYSLELFLALSICLCVINILTCINYEILTNKQKILLSTYIINIFIPIVFTSMSVGFVN